MSAVSSAVATAGTGPRRSERLHGLLWLSWRQNRTLVRVLLAFVLLLAGAIGWCVHGLDAAAGPQHLTAAACTGSPPEASVNGLTVGTVPTGLTPACSAFLGKQGDYINFYQGIVQLALLLAPVVVGMFVGAPLLSREFERRTQLLAWGQSVSPSRWLAARLGSTAAVVLAAFAAAAGLSYWFWRQYVVAGGGDYAFQAKTYDTVGTVLVGYALFALALGVVVGLLVRSVLASVLVTGFLSGASMVVMYLVRPHLYPLVNQVQVGKNAFDGFIPPLNAWMVDSGVVLPDGARVSASVDCGSTACQNSQTFYGVYQPASHFWPLQLVETGVLLVLAAALVAFAFHRVLRGRR